MNRVDLQRAAIVLGHRVKRPVAQPVETLSIPPSETQSSSIWLIVGVVVPVLLAVFIIIILYWKLCGSEKLEFQPDAINTIQQRQKLQAPSVKGFDFAKLHLGQHSKDDIMVIQETGPLPAPIKEVMPSDGGDLNTPKSKGSSTKAARSSRHRGRSDSSTHLLPSLHWASRGRYPTLTSRFSSL
uniref:KIAA1549 n=1 Tax=Nothobranchius kuhntae TaxID=321403 RepID=A0A1A8I0J2_NOTKU